MGLTNFLNNFSQNDLMMAGMFSFTVIALCNIYSLVYGWGHTYWFNKVSTIAYTLFEIGLVLLFRSTYISQKRSSKLMDEEFSKLTEGEWDNGTTK